MQVLYDNCALPFTQTDNDRKAVYLDANNAIIKESELQVKSELELFKIFHSEKKTIRMMN